MITRQILSEIAAELRWRDGLAALANKISASPRDAIHIQVGGVTVSSHSHGGGFRDRLDTASLHLIAQSDMRLRELGFDTDAEKEADD